MNEIPIPLPEAYSAHEPLLTRLGIDLHQFHQQFLIVSAVLLLLLLANLVVLLWHAIASRRVRTAQQAIAGQLGEVQNRLQSVEKLLREVG